MSEPPTNPPAHPGRIAVAMSGGVDSAVAALLLRRAGADVVGFFLRNGVVAKGPGSSRSCCSVSDAADARLVADQLGIPFYAVDVARPFQRIIDGFVDAYRNGTTPNPCVACNVDVKFGHLLELARSIGADTVATGHYARSDHRGGRWRLLRARDTSKDQSYVLATLRQEQLAAARFPLGDLTKAEVRALAREAGLPVADKLESQEICFVPSGDYREFLRERAPEAFAAGDLVDTAGAIVGTHDGVVGFTVGQRKGLRAAFGEPRHVVDIDPSTRRVTIGTREQASAATFDVPGVQWVGIAEPVVGSTLRADVRIRHRHTAAPASVTVVAPGRLRIAFDEPEFAITPGQLAVAYDGDAVMAAGLIESTRSEEGTR